MISCDNRKSNRSKIGAKACFSSDYSYELGLCLINLSTTLKHAHKADVIGCKGM